MDGSKILESIKEAQEKAEISLRRLLGEKHTGNTVVSEAMNYSTLNGGKRIRAYLTMELCRMFGGNEEAAVQFASAVECVHAYSLIHDDLPCMDDDDLRRGKPSCHVKFGEAEALLAGDALLTYAFEILSSTPNVSGTSAAAAVRCLACEAGPVGMVGGQVLDMAEDASTLDELMLIYEKKTSCLITAACLLGYYAACSNPDAETVKKIREYAKCVGLAFQIHDDILDVTSDTATLGKKVGSDEKNGKKTVLKFMSIEEAAALERMLTEKAVNAVSSLRGSENIISLAEWLVTRKK